MHMCFLFMTLQRIPCSVSENSPAFKRVLNIRCNDTIRAISSAHAGLNETRILVDPSQIKRYSCRIILLSGSDMWMEILRNKVLACGIYHV